MFFHVELFPEAHAAGVDEVHDVDVVGAQLVEEAEALDIYRKNRNQRMFCS